MSRWHEQRAGPTWGEVAALAGIEFDALAPTQTQILTGKGPVRISVIRRIRISIVLSGSSGGIMLWHARLVKANEASSSRRRNCPGMRDHKKRGAFGINGPTPNFRRSAQKRLPGRPIAPQGRLRKRRPAWATYAMLSLRKWIGLPELVQCLLGCWPVPGFCHFRDLDELFMIAL